MSREENQAIGGIAPIHYAVDQCTLGAVLVAASASGICAILLGDDTEALVRDLARRFPDSTIAEGGDAVRLAANVAEHLDSPGADFDLPLDLRGTDFQRRVWRALLEIPAGSTATYKAIAERIGSPGAVRAVARACAANAIAVAVPCHRVVRDDGGLSGYHWGAERKQALLEREAAL